MILHERLCGKVGSYRGFFLNMKKASGDIPSTPFSYPKTAGCFERLTSLPAGGPSYFLLCFLVSDDGLFGKLHHAAVCCASCPPADVRSVRLRSARLAAHPHLRAPLQAVIHSRPFSGSLLKTGIGADVPIAWAPPSRPTSQRSERPTSHGCFASGDAPRCCLVMHQKSLRP